MYLILKRLVATLFDKGKLTVSRYVAESINQLIAACFGLVVLCPLHTKQFYETVLYAVDEGLRGRNVLQSVDWLILLRIQLLAYVSTHY